MVLVLQKINVVASQGTQAINAKAQFALEAVLLQELFALVMVYATCLIIALVRLATLDNNVKLLIALAFLPQHPMFATLVVLVYFQTLACVKVDTLVVVIFPFVLAEIQPILMFATSAVFVDLLTIVLVLLDLLVLNVNWQHALACLQHLVESVVDVVFAFLQTLVIAQWVLLATNVKPLFAMVFLPITQVFAMERVFV